VAALVLACFVLPASFARAQSTPQSTVPRTVPFNGQVLTAAGEPRTGAVLLTFGLYPDGSGGTPIWIERQLVTLDKDGRYLVLLGGATPDGLPLDAFAAATARWLGVQVEGEPEQPRLQLLSVPYALKAADADTINGRPASEYVLSSHLADSVKSSVKEAIRPVNVDNVTPNTLLKYADPFGAIAESAIVDFHGRLGININPPSSTLDVKGYGGSTALTMHTPSEEYAADIRITEGNGNLLIGSGQTANLLNLIGNNIGIGTLQPRQKLHVVAPEARLRLESTGVEDAVVEYRTPLSEWHAGLGAFDLGPNVFAIGPTNDPTRPRMVIRYDGSTGMGTTVPVARLDVRGTGRFSDGGDDTVFLAQATTDSAVVESTARFRAVAGKSLYDIGVFAQTSSATQPALRVVAQLPIAETLVDAFTGGVRAFHITGAGTYVAGSDFAEALPVRGDRDRYEPGDVLIISASAPGTVEKAMRRNDPRVAGVYSSRPGMLGADKGGTSRVDADDVPVAIVGIVPTKVSAENGAIHIGDLLTTSSKPGHAMKASPVRVGGTRIYRPGTIVGKALEPLTAGTGTIKVLVTVR
jgi:hypothetical protein